ncbi:MAG TPA: hypothetical protein VGZ02_10715 [Candidatus Baltobacteraceae bacterium]|jgi:hypothetical protein|nr:hypothetical protein [Candidatus Baltobacteraceae bacterium]
MANEIKKTVDDVRDAVKEGIHRGNAAAERDTRESAGDLMTPGEKAGSVARETEENVKAGIDKAKRNIRDAT